MTFVRKLSWNVHVTSNSRRHMGILAGSAMLNINYPLMAQAARLWYLYQRSFYRKCDVVLYLTETVNRIWMKSIES